MGTEHGRCGGSPVLIVEDSPTIGPVVAGHLKRAGYGVTLCATAEQGLGMLKENAFDVILLDYFLPGMSGLDCLAAVRRLGVGTPVLLLSGHDKLPLKIAALEGGADDFLAKPFEPEELVARVGALIRRSQASLEAPASERVRIGAVWADFNRHLLIDDAGEAVSPGEKELAMLRLLSLEPKRVFSRADILEEVWGMQSFPTERTVDNYVVRIRRFIEVDPEHPQHLISVRGRGYRYDP
jgi:DNA-binding response OmpR family regulator